MREPITSYVEERHDFGAADLDPPYPPPGVMWVFVKDGKVVSVNFRCPCGCGAECYTPVHLPGEPKRHTHEWEYQPGPTLSPSIRYLGGCKAHFFIKGGKSKMCEDSGK